jgi:hypothetical protein
MDFTAKDFILTVFIRGIARDASRGNLESAKIISAFG